MPTESEVFSWSGVKTLVSKDRKKVKNYAEEVTAEFISTIS
ncbi:hypothetical protein [Ornithinibacillus caprae]|nr:hypothetical protein [Ornithinibacillus caprae]